MSAARARAEAEEAQETDRGLLAHCHLGRAAAATAWSLRPRPPPPSHPSPLPPSPSSSCGPSPSRRPSQEAFHRASIFYVTSTPGPPPSLAAPTPPRLGRCAPSSLQLLREPRLERCAQVPRYLAGTASKGEPWGGLLFRESAPRPPRPRPPSARSRAPVSPEQRLLGGRDCPRGKLGLPHPSRRLSRGRMLRELEVWTLCSRNDREEFGFLSITLPARVLVFWLVRKLGKQSASLCS